MVVPGRRILLAPLPASLTQPSPHSYRAALIAPLYALLAGLGAAALLQLLARIPRARLRRAAQAAAAALLVVALGWQAGAWFRDYARDYPPQQAWENQDGLLEAMTRAIRYAPGFDEIWISYQNINEPYIYLLAARPMPPAQAQAQIQADARAGALQRGHQHREVLISSASTRFRSSCRCWRPSPIAMAGRHFCSSSGSTMASAF